MILPKEQINRYMRHIIMPEISGAGQKKLLKSKAIIYGENVKEITPLAFYLAASGIGCIACCLQDPSGFEFLFSNVLDLNKDISLELCDLDSKADGFSFRILFGSISFINKVVNNFISFSYKDFFLPTIVAISNGWKGILQSFDNFPRFNDFTRKISDELSSFKADLDMFSKENFCGNTFSASILGTFSCIEFIKLSLDLGEKREEPLYFDLFSLEFSSIHLDYYIQKFLENNSDTLISSSDISKMLSECRILIVGTGGLGSPAALALSLAGVGTLGLMDYDSVELSNLNRQILHSSSRIGMAKVESAKAFLENLGLNTQIITYNTGFNKENAKEIIQNYDIIIDAVDNFPTRFLINDACFFMKKPLIEAGAVKFSGLNTTILPGEGHCYRCAFPNIPSAGSIPSCAESGVLGPVPGVMGFIQAAEAVKLAAGKGQLLVNKFLYFEALDLEFTIVPLSKNPLCPLCGDNPAIESLQGNDFICENKKN